MMSRCCAHAIHQAYAVALCPQVDSFKADYIMMYGDEAATGGGSSIGDATKADSVADGVHGSGGLHEVSANCCFVNSGMSFLLL